MLLALLLPPVRSPLGVSRSPTALLRLARSSLLGTSFMEGEPLLVCDNSSQGCRRRLSLVESLWAESTAVEMWASVPGLFFGTETGFIN